MGMAHLACQSACCHVSATHTRRPGRPTPAWCCVGMAVVVLGCVRGVKCGGDDLVPGEVDNGSNFTSTTSNETVIRDNTYNDPEPDNVALKVCCSQSAQACSHGCSRAQRQRQTLS